MATYTNPVLEEQVRQVNNLAQRWESRSDDIIDFVSDSSEGNEERASFRETLLDARNRHNEIITTLQSRLPTAQAHTDEYVTFLVSKLSTLSERIDSAIGSRNKELENLATAIPVEEQATERLSIENALSQLIAAKDVVDTTLAAVSEGSLTFDEDAMLGLIRSEGTPLDGDYDRELYENLGDYRASYEYTRDSAPDFGALNTEFEQLMQELEEYLA